MHITGFPNNERRKVQNPNDTLDSNPKSGIDTPLLIQTQSRPFLLQGKVLLIIVIINPQDTHSP